MTMKPCIQGEGYKCHHGQILTFTLLVIWYHGTGTGTGTDWSFQIGFEHGRHVTNSSDWTGHQTYNWQNSEKKKPNPTCMW